MPSNAIDEISKEIIEQLQQDGRRSYASIGKAVGLSEAAVRQRVQKLADTGVLHIVAVADPHQLGFTRQAMIGVSAGEDINGTADAIAALPEVSYCVVTSGAVDILAEAICVSDADLLRVTSAIRAIPGVVSTNTLTYLSLKKLDYTRGTDMSR